MAGVTLPGAPAMVAGSNRHIAWGFTNSYGDWSDAIVLQPGTNEGTYRSGDAERCDDAVKREGADGGFTREAAGGVFGEPGARAESDG